jgi:hypothetical protein
MTPTTITPTTDQTLRALFAAAFAALPAASRERVLAAAQGSEHSTECRAASTHRQTQAQAPVAH